MEASSHPRLKRSGVNAMIQTHERVVLPRLTEVVADALDLKVSQRQSQCEYMVLDFSDSLKQLRTQPSERRYLGGEAPGGFIVYRVLIFGVASGQLLWGRVAAQLMRSLQRQHSGAQRGFNVSSMTRSSSRRTEG